MPGLRCIKVNLLEKRAKICIFFKINIYLMFENDMFPVIPVSCVVTSAIIPSRNVIGSVGEYRIQWVQGLIPGLFL